MKDYRINKKTEVLYENLHTGETCVMTLPLWAVSAANLHALPQLMPRLDGYCFKKFIEPKAESLIELPPLPFHRKRRKKAFAAARA